MIALNKLEEVARAATPGPWSTCDAHADNGDFSHVEIAGADGTVIIGEDAGPAQCDSYFIGAANPAAVLELIAAIRKHEAALTEIQGRMGGVLLVQVGLVEALRYALLHLRGEERDVDGVEHKARLALAAAEVML